MTIIISHRGNLFGPDPNTENHPDRIEKAIKFGFHVEVDIRIQNEELWLGHDTCQYKIQKSFLSNNKEKLIIHCKDIPTALRFSNTNYHWFFHESDRCTFTSWKWLWLHPSTHFYKEGVLLDFDAEWAPNCWKDAFGVCTDYPIDIKENLNEFR